MSGNVIHVSVFISTLKRSLRLRKEWDKLCGDESRNREKHDRYLVRIAIIHINSTNAESIKKNSPPLPPVFSAIRPQQNVPPRQAQKTRPSRAKGEGHQYSIQQCSSHMSFMDKSLLRVCTIGRGTGLSSGHPDFEISSAWSSCEHLRCRFLLPLGANGLLYRL